MAGETKSALDTAKDLVTKLGKLAGASPGGDAPTEKSDGGEATGKEARAAARTTDHVLQDVRGRYDTQTAWIVAAMVAIGALLFGSLPFTDAVGVGLTSSRFGGILLGLVLAAIGIATVIWARSRAMEPQDASLRELATTLRATGPVDTGAANPSGGGRRWLRHPLASFRSWVHEPIAAESRTLYDSLGGSAGLVQFGPGLDATAVTPDARVEALLEKIGTLESMIVTRSCAVTADDESRRRTLQEISDLDTAVKKRPAAVESPEQATSPVTTSPVTDADAAGSADLDAGPDATDDPFPGQWRGQHAELVTHLVDDTTARTRRSELTSARTALDAYTGYREMLLVESALAQLRGTFRSSRRVLILGGLLTLLGAVVYTASLPPDDPSTAPTATPAPGPAPRAQVMVTIQQNTPGIDATCADGRTPRHAFLLSPTEAGDDRNGPFTAFITVQPCVGTVTVPEGKGDYTLEQAQPTPDPRPPAPS